ncbi:MAG: hypothetical protein FWH27_16850 [Planctomycetaceae bacterium]|nr:hypothetical protein [Planctomycetaceae bacterium]
MSEQQPTPLTYEGILELFRQTREQMQETDRRIAQMNEEARQRSQELDRRMDRTSREISALGSRVGVIVENMIGGDIVEQFQALGYTVTAHYRNKVFGIKGTSASGEIDLILENGDIVILIEVKTRPKADDVLDHIERLEKYRSHAGKNSHVERRQFIGAIAGASVDPDVVKFAHRKGLYVIVQAGRTVEIITPPEDFVAKKW